MVRPQESVSRGGCKAPFQGLSPHSGVGKTEGHGEQAHLFPPSNFHRVNYIKIQPRDKALGSNSAFSTSWPLGASQLSRGQFSHQQPVWGHLLPLHFHLLRTAAAGTKELWVWKHVRDSKALSVRHEIWLSMTLLFPDGEIGSFCECPMLGMSEDCVLAGVHHANQDKGQIHLWKAGGLCPITQCTWTQSNSPASFDSKYNYS